MTKNKPESTYYEHIDGLRGVAVISILLFHLDFSFFQGGFVGVDIFFVISGYLITSHILEGIKSGTFKFSIFYIKRARRLLPALFFTLLITFLVASFLFPASKLERLGSSTIFSIFSISNFFFWNESGYFDSESTVKPLLHTWSLSVEEQFYILWPSFLLLFQRKWALPVAIFCAGFLSLIISEYYLPKDPAAVFFLTPFRMVEFSIGGMLVMIEKYRHKNNLMQELITIAGLALVAHSVFQYSDTTIFPGMTSLLPCIGAGALIYGGSAKYSGLVLRNWAVVKTGLISYSLYLIHWPLLVFYRYWKNSSLVLTEQLVIIACCFAIATFMYLYIERPFRKIAENYYVVAGKRFGMILTIMVSIIIASALHSRINDGWPWRFNNTQITKSEITEGMERRYSIIRNICSQRGLENCYQPSPNKNKNILILGDSHAHDGLNVFMQAFPDYYYVVKTLGGCPPIADVDNSLLRSNHPHREVCIARNKEMLSSEQLSQYEYVVINVLFGWYKAEHLSNTIDEIKKYTDANIVVFGNYIHLKNEMPELINRDMDPRIDEGTVSTFAVYEDELKALSHEKFLYMSKKDMFCENSSIQSCQVLFDGSPFSYDQHHLSLAATQHIADKLIRKTNGDLQKLFQ